jgi:O-antigen/teichoic acid export membrane protein
VALLGSEQSMTVSRLSPAALIGKAKALLNDGSDRSIAQRLAGAAFMVRVASAALAFISQVLLARWMGGHEFGIYVYAWTWVLLIGGMCDFGLSTSAQRFIPEYAEGKDFSLLRGFISGTQSLVFALGLLTAVVGALLVLIATPKLDHYTIVPLYIACAMLPVFGFALVLSGIARTYNWVNLALMPAFVIRQVLIIGLMAAAFFLALPTDAATAMWVTLVTAVIATAGQAFVLYRRLRKTVPAGPKTFAYKTWLATSLPILMVEGFYLLLTYCDILILQQYRSPEEVAGYYAAAKTLAPVAFVYFAVSQTVAHKFTEYHVSGDRSRLAAFLQSSIKMTFWPSLVAACGLLALGKPLLSLFGPGFSDGYYLMFILALGLLARAAVGPVERLLNMLNEQRLCAVVYAGAFALNIGLCVLLIPRVGVAGAAIATASALIAESIALFVVTKKRLGLHGLIFGGAPN